ncbi:hypothetical protein SCUCBS95973_008647 [Sporothrix curviconia]|uniref:Putative phospholipase n=1 Tax=Sporothrix curviconia TaxID=1260050 RepID=A0ABP0CQX0_9PEZI
MTASPQDSAGAAAKISAYLSRLNPIPAFPEYTGPYKVGTVDIEIPVSDLDSPSPPPDGTDGLHTVQFRIFYPAAPDAQGKRISWLPAPQRSHVSGYTQFLGIGPVLAEFVSFLPRHLHYTSIPALKNAALLAPNTPSGRWPTMVFSHGLGGSRNAYSHIVGSVASHGVVVICPEHRDGSSVVSFVRDPAAQNRFFKQSRRSVVPYQRIPHNETPEIWDLRDKQIRIRLWELGLVHDAVLRIDEASQLTNLNMSTPPAAVAQFTDKLEVHNPGDIIWAGHSFGSASIVQLLKTTYYADAPELTATKPLYTPKKFSRLREQITEKSPTILLDMWCFPLLSPSQRALHDLPLPVYAADVPTAPGGAGLLAVASESFVKWVPHLHATARILSPNPAEPVVSLASYERPSGVRLPEPNVFYVKNSAHLNQSDFGLLFPWLTKKVFGAEEPERAIRLNLRAILQMLRANGVAVARTWVGDLVDGADVDKLDRVVKAAAPSAPTTATACTPAAGEDESSGSTPTSETAPVPTLTLPPPSHVIGDRSLVDGIHDDKAIFDRSGRGTVEYWQWIDMVGMGAEAADSYAKGTAKGKDGQPADVVSVSAPEDIHGDEQGMEAEIEPHLGAAHIPSVVSSAA